MNWKNESNGNTALLIEGARRIGKSTVVETFGKNEYESYMLENPCPECKGARLKPEYLAVTVGGKNIKEFCDMSVESELEFINTLKFGQRDSMIAKPILKEIRERLTFLQSVGLEYLNLSRSSGTLSGRTEANLPFTTSKAPLRN